MVFSFFMLNAIWVVTIYMLQAQKETINIPWFFPKSYNVSYLLDEDIGPVVEIAENKLIFEPISKFCSEYIQMLHLSCASKYGTLF